MATLDDVLLLVTILAGVIFVPWVFLIRPWLRRRQVAPVEQPQVVDLAERREHWSLRGELARLFLVENAPRDMSSGAYDRRANRAVAAPLPATSTDDRQRIGMPGNAVNAELPGNVLPEEAREIVRFQARVEAVIAIVESGKLGQTEAIERIFGVKRSGRPDSPYARARAAVEAQQKPQRPELVGEMIERVQREVAAEGR
jgi:hypothetical protein